MRALLLHLRPVQLEGKKLTEGIEELLTELSRKQHMKIEWLIELYFMQKIKNMKKVLIYSKDV
ncbi:hypothetical protein bcgnr5369_68580 [Bacillus cereus]